MVGSDGCFLDFNDDENNPITLDETPYVKPRQEDLSLVGRCLIGIGGVFAAGLAALAIVSAGKFSDYFRAPEEKVNDYLCQAGEKYSEAAAAVGFFRLPRPIYRGGSMAEPKCKLDSTFNDYIWNLGRMIEDQPVSVGREEARVAFDEANALFVDAVKVARENGLNLGYHR